jgi:dipeptidyl aminopeptidase/acylaminoacyl peptidase
MRDRLAYDRWVQLLTARGYAVLQPNFRGSDGFGRSFAESGYGEWGRAMQDDITDGLASLVQQEIVDPGRVCIVGASYGGYAALAGAALTPNLYKCAVSIAGVSDLSAFVKWYKFEHGPDSAGLAYWLRAIGDPEHALHRLRAVSPVHLADAIKADVLLIHGDKDEVVPLSQSQAMKRALDNSSRKITLLKLEDEGHSYWSDENERLALENIAAFLAKNLGPGFGATQSSGNNHAQ